MYKVPNMLFPSKYHILNNKLFQLLKTEETESPSSANAQFKNGENRTSKGPQSKIFIAIFDNEILFFCV